MGHAKKWLESCGGSLHGGNRFGMLWPILDKSECNSLQHTGRSCARVFLYSRGNSNSSGITGGRTSRTRFVKRKSIKVLIDPLRIAFSACLMSVVFVVWSARCSMSSTYSKNGGGSDTFNAINYNSNLFVRGGLLL